MRHIHFNIETIQYLYTGVKGNSFHVDLFFFCLGLDDWKRQTRGWGHYLQLALTCLQVAWGNVTKLKFPEDNIRRAFHEVQVFPALPTAEDSGRKRVRVLVPGASVAFSLVLIGKKNRKLAMFTTM